MSLLPDLSGSFSTPAADNPTGAMMEAAYAHHGIDARYVNCDVAAEEPRGCGAGARGPWAGSASIDRYRTRWQSSNCLMSSPSRPSSSAR